MGGKYLGIFFVVISLMLFACDKIQKEDTSWLKGGTLHKATVRQWKQATEGNKLATCADFVVALNDTDSRKFNSIEEIKISAHQMKACLDEVINGDTVTDDMKINEIAVLCDINFKSFN